MDELMKKKVLEQLVLIENALFCEHDPKKACKECVKKISNYSWLIGDCSELIGDCSGLIGDCIEIKEILKQKEAKS